ncbi:hypothetical protein [Thauera mechernichensis]|nr:hypothetical protein [Thauera mechernichensis]MDG3065881.1 hypothetical protein [Thauera mechernichensis]
MDNHSTALPSKHLMSRLSLEAPESLYDYIEQREVGEPGFRASVASMYKRNARWSNPLTRIAVTATAHLLSPRASSVKYFFWGTKFRELILGLNKKEVCIIGGPKQALFCLRNGIPFIASTQLWKELHIGIQHNHYRTQKITSLIKKAEIQLEMTAGHDAMLVVDNDSLPMQRAVILSAHLAGLKTVCIQHGIFQSKSPGHIMDGWTADLFLAINSHQRDMLITKGLAPDKIYIMGFHSSPYQPKRPTAPPKERKVCFLGQPWTKYGTDRGQRYFEILRAVTTALENNNINLFYKPHPWERGSAHLKDIRNVIDTPLNASIEEYDVFISITSTALLEVATAGRVAIQVIDSIFDADDLSVHAPITPIPFNHNAEFNSEFINAISKPIDTKIHTQSPLKNFIKITTKICGPAYESCAQ